MCFLNELFEKQAEMKDRESNNEYHGLTGRLIKW